MYGAVYQFEEGMPESIKAGKGSQIAITQEKYKDGKHSLKWNFKGNDTLTIFGDTELYSFDHRASTGKSKIKLCNVDL